MNNLIEELRKEHKEIFNMLKKVIDYHVSTEMGQERLFLTREVLLEHLKKEDREFYPILYKAAKSDEKLEKLLCAYEDNMREVTKLSNEFFENHSKGDLWPHFFKDFVVLFIKLKDRTAKEENVFFNEFEKLMGHRL
jgi:hypothetical protein